MTTVRVLKNINGDLWNRMSKLELSERVMTDAKLGERAQGLAGESQAFGCTTTIY